MVAVHLLKAVQGWTDLGLGSFALHYLRDKLEREVRSSSISTTSRPTASPATARP
jgi:hypothetical protein